VPGRWWLSSVDEGVVEYAPGQVVRVVHVSRHAYGVTVPG
jgi:hypothetical protein